MVEGTIAGSSAMVVRTEKMSQVSKIFFQQAHRLIFSQLSLSPIEHDLFALLLNRLDKDHWQPFGENGEIREAREIQAPHYSFNADVLSLWLGVDKRDMYNIISEPAKRLSSKQIGIQDPGSKRFRYNPLFKEIRYESGQLTIVPNEMLMNEYLCLSQGHAAIYNDTFKALTTDPAKRLYTALCRFKSEGKLHAKSLSEWHGFFGLLDQSGKLAKKSYAKTSTFIERIISPAVAEISQKEPRIRFITDEVSGNCGWAYTKERRKITHIEFLFKWEETPADIGKQEKRERQKLESEQEKLSNAVLVWELVNSYSKGDDGNPSVEELNNMMMHVPQLMAQGKVMCQAFMTKYSKALEEATHR